MSNPIKLPLYKTLPIGQIEPYAQNARTHSKEQIAQIAASIERFGFTNPLLVDEFHRLIAGHGRLLAAQLLGLLDVPAIVVADLSEAERRALVIADNKLALNAGWDFELLASELQELAISGFDLDLTGFNSHEIEGMLLPQVDAREEWQGMPDYEQEHVAYQSIRMHFRDAEAVQSFARLLGQAFTPKTRSAWFPIAQVESREDKFYASTIVA